MRQLQPGELAPRKIQLLETTGFRHDDGTAGLIIQIGFLGDVERPMLLSLWDARRLVAQALAILNTLEPDNERVAKVFGTLQSFTDPARPDWFENGDPGVGPWPPESKSQKRSRKRRRE